MLRHKALCNRRGAAATAVLLLLRAPVVTPLSFSFARTFAHLRALVCWSAAHFHALARSLRCEYHSVAKVAATSRMIAPTSAG